jgi:hypothetical protein
LAETNGLKTLVTQVLLLECCHATLANYLAILSIFEVM